MVLLEKYSEVIFDVKCLMVNPVTKQWIVFLPDMPHLTKNIVTSLELSLPLNLKQDLKYGNAPMNIQMIEEIWLKCDGTSGQLQFSILTTWHFEKNTYSWMNVSLATQLLSQSTTEIHNGISDNTVALSLCNKGIYNHVADFCERWNVVLDI
jgi:hypothetical protein